MPRKCEYSTDECPEAFSACPCVEGEHHDDRDSPAGQHHCKHDCTSGFLFDPRLAKAEDA